MEKRKKGHLINRTRNTPELKTQKSEMIFGTRAIIEAIEAGKEIEKILLQRGLQNDLIKSLVHTANRHSIPIQNVPIEKLNRITGKNHQGSICFLSAIQYASLDHVINSVFEKGKMPLVLILDRITDVRNFGAIARTAECEGVDTLVIPSRGSAQITSDAMKTSAGALNHLPVCRENNLKQTITYLKECGFYVVGCSEKGEQMIYDLDFQQPLAIVLGSEEDGISPEYLKLVNAEAKIPMSGKIASLNVSVAAGMIMYEVARQRNSL